MTVDAPGQAGGDRRRHDRYMHYLVPCNPNCPALDKCLRDEQLSDLQGTADWRDFLRLYQECLDGVSLKPDPAFLPTQPAW